METEAIRRIIDRQREFFATGATLSVSYRLDILKKLRKLILENEQELVRSLWKDFHKPEFEVIATETRFVLKELNFTIKRLRFWSRNRHVRTPLVHFLSRSYVKPQPYGQVLILSPWNFPFQLAFMPLVGAIAAGNCAIVKVSRQAPATTAVMEKIMSCLPEELAAMINGDHSVSEYLLNHKFDYIFFTGSTEIGRYVMEKAARNLTPVSLELGGKNPCVVAADAKLDYAARRIVWGKFLNAGQTCICPDYILVDDKVKERFLELVVREIESCYGSEPEESRSFARVISPSNVGRIQSLMTCGKIIAGGSCDAQNSFIEPTVITDVMPGDPIMKQEIFGPLMPVIGFSSFEEVYDIIELNPRPLATYIFSRNHKLVRSFIGRTRAGTAGVNDVVMQIASPYLPYGGIGPSGIGRYHGKKSFETFSNMRSVLQKSNLFDIPVRYAPYSKLKTGIVKLLMR